MIVLIKLNTQIDRPMVAPKLLSFTSLKSSLYRSHRSRMPPLPKSRDEIESHENKHPSKLSIPFWLLISKIGTSANIPILWYVSFLSTL